MDEEIEDALRDLKSTMEEAVENGVLWILSILMVISKEKKKLCIERWPEELEKTIFIAAFEYEFYEICQAIKEVMEERHLAYLASINEQEL